MTKDEYLDTMGTKMKGGIFSLIVLYIITSSRKPIHGYAITKGLMEGTGTAYTSRRARFIPS